VGVTDRVEGRMVQTVRVYFEHAFGCRGPGGPSFSRLVCNI
jgi:hypothetical protein